ncbi:MAG: hydrogenase 3 maturation endopeptidase HyCI [Candidatus Omnitrophica bacterium]|nr:hydrogenase 3 maturation endopeptidase HyCI [Candidatus Omnitrophota bacterium]MCM8792970.1 hydrogenase 3 maturation endopeptidase HyCI [Candidatus Omnitrophota bacterium]
MNRTIFEKLENILGRKAVILGIGNPLRGDDAFGSLFAEKILNKVRIKVYNGGSSPENILGKIISENPDTILLVDAVDFGGNYGEIILINVEGIETTNIFFTHNFSLHLVFDFLKENTQARIYLLAIQPKSINLGDKLSSEVEKEFNLLSRWLLERYSIER